jgi:hypothetical protein
MERVAGAASIARGHSQRLAPGARDYTGQMDKANRVRAQEEGVVGTVDERLIDVQHRVKTLENVVASQQEQLADQGLWIEKLLDAISGTPDGSVTGLWDAVFGPTDDEGQSRGGGLVDEVAELVRSRQASRPGPKPSAKPTAATK